MSFNIPAFDQVTANEHPLLGNSPSIFHGKTAPSGANYPWKTAALGSIYVQKGATQEARTYQKVQSANRDDDWAALGGLHVISQRITRAEFTDGGSTTGTLVLDQDIPQGAFVVRCYLLNVTGFTGNTSATIQVGDGSTVARYTTGTPSVFTTANAIDLGAVSGTAIHAAAVTAPTVTITANSDFTAVSAGAATIRILYYL